MIQGNSGLTGYLCDHGLPFSGSGRGQQCLPQQPPNLPVVAQEGSAGWANTSHHAHAAEHTTQL